MILYARLRHLYHGDSRRVELFEEPEEKEIYLANLTYNTWIKLGGPELEVDVEDPNIDYEPKKVEIEIK